METRSIHGNNGYPKQARLLAQDYDHPSPHTTRQSTISSMDDIHTQLRSQNNNNTTWTSAPDYDQHSQATWKSAYDDDQQSTSNSAVTNVSSKTTLAQALKAKAARRIAAAERGFDHSTIGSPSRANQRLNTHNIDDIPTRLRSLTSDDQLSTIPRTLPTTASKMTASKMTAPKMTTSSDIHQQPLPQPQQLDTRSFTELAALLQLTNPDVVGILNASLSCMGTLVGQRDYQMDKRENAKLLTKQTIRELRSQADEYRLQCLQLQQANDELRTAKGMPHKCNHNAAQQ